MKKGDIAIIALVILLAFTWSVTSHKGGVAAVYIDGELYRKLPLSQDTTLVIESEFGTNTLVIENNTARLVHSDCPGKQCESSAVGETAHALICLPNRLSVIIEDNKNDNGTDVII